MERITKLQIVGGLAAAALFLLLLVAWVAFDFEMIEGNQVGVRQSGFSGVEKDPLPPGTYLVYPWQKLTKYSTAMQIFVMNDRPETAAIEGRQSDVYLVQSADNQDMKLSMQVQWRIDPAKVVDLHQHVGPEMIEEKALRPTLLRVVKDCATVKEAITAYSGEGLVQLQQEIETKLVEQDGDLRANGIIVDSFVIEGIGLDDEYKAEIQKRQLATVKQLRAVEEEKAMEAEALVAKAEAQADLNRAVVKADQEAQVLERDTEAQANKKKTEAVAVAETAKLVAVAEAEKLVAIANAEKEAAEAKAAATLAAGKALAESEKLKFAAYAEPGAETFAKIEVAKSMGQSLSGIRGYVPEDMTVFTLGSNYLNALDAAMGKVEAATPATRQVTTK